MSHLYHTNLTDLTLLTRGNIRSLYVFIFFTNTYYVSAHYSFIKYTVRICKEYISNYKATNYGLTLSPKTSVRHL